MSEKGKNSLLTTAEVAARLGVTRWRINALIKSKRLPAERFGAIFLVRESDLRLVENRKPGRPRKSKKLQ
ncbi:MAG TPA: helix-turn-helix domain-containing protein [Pyrinomonadaceae bacterium]|jgi:excisionase family DNA binding protein